MSEDNKPVTMGQRISYLRKQKGLSIAQLAEHIMIPYESKKIDVTKKPNELMSKYFMTAYADSDDVKYKPVSAASISNLENDKHKPNSDLIIALAYFFKVSTDWLLTGKESGFRQEPPLFSIDRDEFLTKELALKQRIIDELRLNLDHISRVSREVLEQYDELVYTKPTAEELEERSFILLQQSKKRE